MVINIKFVFCLAIILSIFSFYAIFLSTSSVLAIDDGSGNQLPDLAPLPAPLPEPPHLNDPPKTYAGQVIIKYTQNYKENSEYGMPPDEGVITAVVTGTIYPLYETSYDTYFTGIYLFKEGQMSWSYNAKGHNTNGYCEYSVTSVGSGNTDIAHTDKILSDSKISLESDGKYTIDVNNNERIYLAADGLPVNINCNEDGCTGYDLAQKPVQITSTPTSNSPSYCQGEISNDVPPEIVIKLENIKSNKNILSGEETLHPGAGVTEMISYTIELPSVKQDSNAPEEPAISNDNPDKQSLLDIFFNWIKNLFN